MVFRVKFIRDNVLSYFKSYIRSIFTFKPFTVLKIQVVEPLGKSAMSSFTHLERFIPYLLLVSLTDAIS